MNRIFSRIEFWIILFFLIRMIGITNPPIEIGHSWRQVTGLMVTRNFIEVDANILYPRIDDNQGGTGIIGMEFPVLNYLYFLIAKIFGYTHWYGRLINLLMSSIGLFYFYKLVNKYFGHRHAFLSTLCLIGSIWFAFSRKMMPDTFCISLMFIGVFYGTEYLEQGRKNNILLYIFFVSLAILSKIPAGIYLSVFIPLLINVKNSKRKWIFCITSFIPLTLTYIWYFIWNPYLSVKYGIWYNSGKAITTGFNEVISNLGLALEKFYFSSFNSYFFFTVFIIGLFLMVIKKKSTLIYLFVVVSIVFIIYIFKSGFYFYHHNYYIIPFVPIMALVAGYSISLIKTKWIFISVLSIGMIESIANQQNDFFMKKSEKYKLALETVADSISSKDDLIAINGNGNPQQIYLTHRKGWTCDDGQLLDSAFINYLYNKGCKFLFVNKHTCKESINKRIVFDNDDFKVYELNMVTGKMFLDDKR